MVLILDNYDSFTYNLRDYCQQSGMGTLVVRNDEIDGEGVEALKPSGILISPGPKGPVESGATMEVVSRFAGKVPMLGVCLGHQAIGLFAGANLEKAPYPVHGKVSRVHFKDHQMFRGIPQPMEVCRYHSLAIRNLPEDWIALGYADDGVLMAFAHRQWPVWAVQFHPEAILTTFGLQFIRNWVDSLNTKAKTHSESHKYS